MNGLSLYFCHRSNGDTLMDDAVRAGTARIRYGNVLDSGTSEELAAQSAEGIAIVSREYLELWWIRRRNTSGCIVSVQGATVDCSTLIACGQRCGCLRSRCG
ncbi:MAG TPA: hypothetical protein ACQGQG_05875 [Xylella sp.]